jgi:hypothetical protein
VNTMNYCGHPGGGTLSWMPHWYGLNRPMGDMAFLWLNASGGYSGELVSIGGTTTGNVPVNNFEGIQLWIVLDAAAIDLQGTLAGHATRLSWSHDPASVREYVVERSADGQSFAAIGQAAPGSGTAHAFSDAHPLPGPNYYRIRIAGADGSMQVSGAVTVHVPVATMELALRPAAGYREYRMHYALPAGTTSAQWMVASTDGKKCLAGEVANLQGDVNLDMSAWSPGVYLVHIVAGSHHRTVRIAMY